MLYRYEHPDFFADVEKPDFSKYSGKIILYGAGRRGAVAAHALKKMGIEFICFSDSNTTKHGTIFCDHEVISPEQLSASYRSAPVIVTTSSFLSVKKKLETLGINNVFNCISLFMAIDFTDFDSSMSFAYLVRNMDLYFDTMLKQMGDKTYFPNLYLLTTPILGRSPMISEME